MDWTVNYGLYHRVLKWRLKCENILECELAMIAERRNCKKVIAWSEDFGIDQYVSWNLANEELTLDVIWEKFEECCKPQSNEVRAGFDLLTSFRQGERSVDELYNAVQTQVTLAKYPQETTKILHRDIFCFFLHDEEFVSKTINDRNIDLNKFPASKVRQLAKKMESSKATAKHIKQVACNPQAAQIHLIHHQHTELPPSQFQRKQKKQFKSEQDTNGQYYNEEKQKGPPVHKKYEAHASPERCKKCGDSQHIDGFRCPASRYQCRNCHKYGHFSRLCYKKKEAFDKKRSLESRSPKAHQLQIGSISYVASWKKVQVMIHSASN